MIWTAATANPTQTAPARRRIADAVADGVKWSLPAPPAMLARRAARALHVVLAKSAEEWNDEA